MGYKFLIKDISAPNCRFNEAFAALLLHLCRARLGSQGRLNQWDSGLGCALSPLCIPERYWGAQQPLELRRPTGIFSTLGLPRFEPPGTRTNPGSALQIWAWVWMCPSSWDSGDRGHHTQAWAAAVPGTVSLPTCAFPT